MNKKFVGIVVCMQLIISGTIAVADWDPEDGHKMHWPQTPDPNGWDVYCTAGLTQWPWVVLADDWQCSESGWIKDIHFWGSWYRDLEGIIDHFVIGIAENIPEDPPENPYSKPGQTLIEWEIYDWVERGPYTGDQGWYWSYHSEWEPDNHQQYWQYNVFLNEEDWFWQEEGKIYWLFISAVVKEEPVDQPLWGWKSTKEDLQFMDAAVWAIWYDLDWIPLTYPYGLIMDLAFVITGGEHECNPSIEVLKFVKDPRSGEWVDASSSGGAIDIKVGATVEFKIVLTNDGEPPFDGIVVNDTMEGGLEFISATPPPSSTVPLQWDDLGPLDPGVTKEIIVRAKVVGENCNIYYQKVWGYAPCACGEPGCNCPPQYFEYYAYIHAPRARSVNRPIFNFLESYQNLFPILWLLLQRLGL